MKTQVISPAIPEYFRNNETPKKLMISVVAKDQSLVNKIVKQFHWKFPSYRWVTFTDLRGLAREDFSNSLRESAITIWADDDTYFGYAPIEAIKSGSILIGKVPNVIPEWMYNEDQSGLTKAGIWFTDLRDVQKITANAVKAWMDDLVPDDLYNQMKTFDDKYTVENRRDEISTVFGEYIKNRVGEMNSIKDKITNKNK